MSATEIIEELKRLPLNEKEAVRAFLEQSLAQQEFQRLYDDFTLLGSDAEACSVSYAESAQAEVIRYGR